VNVNIILEIPNAGYNGTIITVIECVLRREFCMVPFYCMSSCIAIIQPASAQKLISHRAHLFINFGSISSDRVHCFPSSLHHHLSLPSQTSVGFAPDALAPADVFFSIFYLFSFERNSSVVQLCTWISHDSVHFCPIAIRFTQDDVNPFSLLGA